MYYYNTTNIALTCSSVDFLLMIYIFIKNKGEVYNYMGNNKSLLGSRLSYLASMGNNNQDTFNNPYVDQSVITDVDINEHIKTTKERKKDKKKKGDRFSRYMEESEKLIQDICDDESIFEFDNYLEYYFSEDEDVQLRNNLINMGRKYNRDNSMSAEDSNVMKAFAGNEKALDNLLEEINRDKAALQKDIDSLRMSRVKSYKNIADLIAAKNQIHNSALQIIKESHSIKKTQFDLQNKIKAKKDDDDANNSASSRAISNLFGIGRSNILSSVGGYESVSGAIVDADNASISPNIYSDDDEEIQKKYFSNNKEDDGDKFLKYENRGVEYILLVHPDGHKDIIAEDKNGDLVPDYPMPSNLNELNFDINESTQTASDDYHRRYKVRQLYDNDNE